MYSPGVVCYQPVQSGEVIEENALLQNCLSLIKQFYWNRCIGIIVIIGEINWTIWV
jgi:hypothetical protein